MKPYFEQGLDAGGSAALYVLQHDWQAVAGVPLPRATVAPTLLCLLLLVLVSPSQLYEYGHLPQTVRHGATRYAYQLPLAFLLCYP
jgi:hypothetical protein